MVKAVIFDMYETLITHYHNQGSLYFSAQIAEDIGIPVNRFQPLWRSLEHERTVGKLSLEDTLEIILKRNQCYSEELVKRVVDKRIAIAETCFQHLHPEIISMLSCLKEKGISVGLISNCFSDEAEVIRRSVLFPYFDAVCLSYEQGVEKPDEKIYQICMDMLSVNPEECIYVGDGGSQELETARDLGMHALQACWYFREELGQNARRKEDFQQIERPMNIVELL